MEEVVCEQIKRCETDIQCSQPHEYTKHYEISMIVKANTVVHPSCDVIKKILDWKWGNFMNIESLEIQGKMQNIPWSWENLSSALKIDDGNNLKSYSTINRISYLMWHEKIRQWWSILRKHLEKIRFSWWNNLVQWQYSTRELILHPSTREDLSVRHLYNMGQKGIRPQKAGNSTLQNFKT